MPDLFLSPTLRSLALSIARSKARRFPSLWVGELENVALMGLWRASKAYSESKGKENNFVALCVTNALKDLFRQKSREPRHHTLADTHHCKQPNQEHLMEVQDSMQVFLRRIPAQHARILRARFLEEKTNQEIMDQEGLALTSLYKIFNLYFKPKREARGRVSRKKISA